MSEKKVFSNENDLEEYLDEQDLTLRQIEVDIQRLNQDPTKQDVIFNLFRKISSIKNNAALHYINAVVLFVGPIEDLVTAFKTNKFTFSPVMGEAILLALDRIKWAGPDWLANNSPEAFLPESISNAFSQLANSENDKQHIDALKNLTKLLGIESDLTNINITVKTTHEPQAHIAATEQQKADLLFFRDLSLRLEKRAPYWEGRTDRLIHTALRTNELAGNLIDPIQLEAAVYMHDIGMGFLSDSIWTKHGKLTDQELAALREHPALSAGILKRMNGWNEAAQMVEQHHERLDGAGYPKGLKEKDITPGAKLLAIIDAFEAMTHERIDRHYKKSVLRAIAELNACENQFSSQWVQIFNKIVRTLLEPS